MDGVRHRGALIAHLGDDIIEAGRRRICRGWQSTLRYATAKTQSFLLWPSLRADFPISFKLVAVQCLKTGIGGGGKVRIALNSVGILVAQALDPQARISLAHNRKVGVTSFYGLSFYGLFLSDAPAAILGVLSSCVVWRHQVWKMLLNTMLGGEDIQQAYMAARSKTRCQAEHTATREREAGPAALFIGTGFNRRPLQRVSRRLYKTFVLRLRSALDARPLTIPHDKVASLRFFQFNERTAPFLSSLANAWPVCVRDTPHALFAAALASGARDSTGEQLYADYLRTSWENRAEDRIVAKTLSFRAFFERSRLNEIKLRPVVLTRLVADGPLFVVDGNHRCALAYALGRDLEAEVLPFDLVVRLGLASSVFRSALLNPHTLEEVRIGGHIAIPGVYDELEFLNLVPNRCIVGRRLLDLNAGFGARSVLARERGAAEVLGVEQRHRFADMATRWAMIQGGWPHVRFCSRFPDDFMREGSAGFDVVFWKHACADMKLFAQGVQALAPVGWKFLIAITASDFSPGACAGIRGFPPKRLGTLRARSRRAGKSLSVWLFEA